MGPHLRHAEARQVTARKSVENSKPGVKNLKPFRKGDGRPRGRGPAKGAPNAGRPPDFLKALKQQGAEKATEQIHALLKAKSLDPDQLIKIAKEFDATPQKVDVDATLTIRFE